MGWTSQRKVFHIAVLWSILHGDFMLRMRRAIPGKESLRAWPANPPQTKRKSRNVRQFVMRYRALCAVGFLLRSRALRFTRTMVCRAARLPSQSDQVVGSSGSVG
ncbi:hypothetical protein BDZ88DRAFT_407008 [Geranomyces variabilis]|nr:hypothetical protein BDZ88DRAFT_407008 [Geranomyces variabilis]